MPNNVAKVLNSPDTYRYAALSFTPLKKGYTDSTFKQIAEYINPNKPESERTIENFINRLKKAGLMQINEVFEKGLRRNHYYIPQPIKNFRMIKNEFLYLDLDIKLKGFLLQLLSITINDTFQIGWTIARISREVKVSRPAATKYMKELIDKEFVKEIEGGYEIISDYFILGKTSREKEIETIKEFAKTSAYFTDRFNEINWEDVKYPKEYWEASVVMRLRAKENLKGDTDDNTTIIV